MSNRIEPKVFFVLEGSLPQESRMALSAIGIVIDYYGNTRPIALSELEGKAILEAAIKKIITHIRTEARAAFNKRFPLDDKHSRDRSEEARGLLEDIEKILEGIV